jgi:hypothetical protein
MKKFLTLITLIISTASAIAQTPQGINYQAEARDNSGNPWINHTITVRATITDGNGGTTLYQEVQVAATNQFGLFTLNIGSGISSGRLDSVKWGAVHAWMHIEYDPNGGTTYKDMGTFQLLSVPYALYAASSGSVTPNIGFKAVNSGGQTTLPAATTTQLSYNSVAFNDGGAFSSDQFTAPSAGVYHFEVAALFNPLSSAGRLGAYIYVNGVNNTGNYVYGTTDYSTVGVNATIHLNAGDVVTAWVYPTMSTAQSLLNLNYYNYFSGFKVY